MALRTLQQGEDIFSVATSAGLPWRKVWSHPQNEALRQRRSSPHLLLPGDSVFVPELERRSLDAATEKRHRFRRRQDRLRFRLRLFERRAAADSRVETAAGPSCYEEPAPGQAEERPLAGVPFRLVVEGGEEQSGETDGEGFVDVALPPGVVNAVLVLDPGEAAERRIDLRWRCLDPVEELSGVSQRLTNLGFPCPPAPTGVTEQIAAAIAAFQRLAGLDPTGEVDDRLRQALVDAHGA